jgi:hypothetical protein
LEITVSAGWMIPEMNWALKLLSYMCSLDTSNSAIDWPRCPNTFTRSCPENVSSTCPLSRPVHFHWAMKCGCERLAMSIVTTKDSGTVRSEIVASSGLIQNIIPSTPMTVRTAVMSWVSVCWSVIEMLSMSFVTRLSTSPRDEESK